MIVNVRHGEPGDFILEDIRINKLNESVIIDRCLQLGVDYVGRHNEKGRLLVDYICPVHHDKGIQSTITSKFMKRKHKCNYCAGKKWDTAALQEIVSSKHPNIKITSQYAGDESRISCECIDCGNTWITSAHNLKQGTGCPPCSFKKMGLNERNDENDVRNRIAEAQPNIVMVGAYEGFHKNVDCICSDCGTSWSATPANLIRLNTGCPLCRGKELIAKLRWSQEEVNDMIDRFRPDVTLISPYFTYHEKMKCFCQKHNRYYEQSLGQILEGHRGCPSCQTLSLGELKLHELLNTFGIDYITQAVFDGCKHKSDLKFDVYIPNLRTAIEYDGEGHYFPIDFAGKGHDWAQEQFQLSKIRDSIKDKYCEENNITLIRIPYFEYDNMEMYLKQKLNQCS